MVGGNGVNDRLSTFRGDFKFRSLVDTAHFLECVNGRHCRLFCIWIRMTGRRRRAIIMTIITVALAIWLVKIGYMYIEDKDYIYVYTLYIYIIGNFVTLRAQAAF